MHWIVSKQIHFDTFHYIIMHAMYSKENYAVSWTQKESQTQQNSEKKDNVVFEAMRKLVEAEYINCL